ncbi:MAG: hypothetical protein R2838_14945 [Caldilineaceae bacterium]
MSLDSAPNRWCGKNCRRTGWLPLPAPKKSREVTTPLDHDGVRSRFDFRLVGPAHPVGSK